MAAWCLTNEKQTLFACVGTREHRLGKAITDWDKLTQAGQLEVISQAMIDNESEALYIVWKFVCGKCIKTEDPISGISINALID